MYACRFEAMKNNRWKCTRIWDVPFDGENVFRLTRHAYLNCKTRPPIGFCKRPHNYL